MNRSVLMGRLTRDPDIRQAGETNIAMYSLAVDRRGKKDEADFINIVAFGKSADFAGKYLHKGMRICVSGRIQTGSYTNKDGQKVYTFDVVAEDQEFCESKAESKEKQADPLSGFINVPEEAEELPFV